MQIVLVKQNIQQERIIYEALMTTVSFNKNCTIHFFFMYQKIYFTIVKNPKVVNQDNIRFFEFAECVICMDKE